jgi:hypothetical protein
MVVLDEILAKVMVDEVGIKTSLRILEKANEAFVEQHPGIRLNADYVRLAGAAKLYDLEQHEEDATNGKDTSSRYSERDLSLVS